MYYDAKLRIYKKRCKVSNIIYSVLLTFVDRPLLSLIIDTDVNKNFYGPRIFPHIIPNIESMLASGFTTNLIEAGCDEAGRGCLAGPVFAAAVILPKNFKDPLLNDSKLLSETHRVLLKQRIEERALAWAVAKIGNSTIDKINILNASIRAMHDAITKLNITPEVLLIDGNRFKPYRKIPFHCIIKGDGKYMSIAAASILAKTYRDEYMVRLHKQHPDYEWRNNKGYPTQYHRSIIVKQGITSHHRRSFRLLPLSKQQSIFGNKITS